mgnify:CR=1 FL=1
MPFEFKKTEIEGLMLIKPHMYPDERGLYKKYYEKNIFVENGITCEFTESSDLYSKKGALRGLHYQTVDSQAKLIHVISGVLFDVALDLRENSPTFGQYHTELLKAEDQFVTYIPEGFAHGFISLTDDTIFSYQCSGKYVPSACGGIRWNDPELNIPWPLKEYGVEHIIATEKDKNWPTLAEYIALRKRRRSGVMKKAIVTGATGFIGKFLVRELVKQNVEVIAVVRRGTKNLNTINALPVKIVECNIADYHMLPDMIADRDIDVVFHIAWQGVSDLDARNEAIQMQNLQSTLDLIDALHIMKIGCFIGCGSMHEAESLVEMNEDKVISNLGYMYKATKTAAHWIGKAKCGTYGIRFFWPLINTYGEEERSARLVNTIIRKVFHGETPDLSAGNQYYDFVHVSDVARALILIAEKGVDGTNYTIGSGDAKPLKEFLKIVGQVANDLHGGEPVELGFGKITSNVISLPITIFDVTKLYKDTGFKPLIPFREGIERTARWIKEDEGM